MTIAIISGNDIGKACYAAGLADRLYLVGDGRSVTYDMLDAVTVIIGVQQRIPADWLVGRVLIGFHPTLLPHGRGGSPIQRQILENAPPGITFFRMAETLDAGNILGQVALPASRTSAEYYDACRVAAPKLLRLVLMSDLRGAPQTLLPARRRLTDDDQRAMDPDTRSRVYSGPYKKYLLEEYR